MDSGNYREIHQGYIINSNAGCMLLRLKLGGMETNKKKTAPCFTLCFVQRIEAGPFHSVILTDAVKSIQS